MYNNKMRMILIIISVVLGVVGYSNKVIAKNDKDIIIEAIPESEYQERLEMSNDEDENKIAYASKEVISPYEGYITKYMDLKNRKDISASDMDYIIEYYTNLNGCGSNTELYGMGEAFIIASQQTGYDPIFLLALAATEGGWEVSSLHSSKCNPYSINMVDSNPHAGYTLGDTYYDGIINGAKFINDNYYNEGYTTLHSMIYGGKRYASSADYWIDSITLIMDKSYKLLDECQEV